MKSGALVFFPWVTLGAPLKKFQEELQSTRAGICPERWCWGFDSALSACQGAVPGSRRLEWPRGRLKSCWQEQLGWPRPAENAARSHNMQQYREEWSPGGRATGIPCEGHNPQKLHHPQQFLEHSARNCQWNWSSLFKAAAPRSDLWCLIALKSLDLLSVEGVKGTIIE